MTEFANAGYGKVMQVLMPGIAFGLAHAGYLNQVCSLGSASCFPLRFSVCYGELRTSLGAADYSL